MRVTLIQMSIDDGRPEANLSHALDLLDSAGSCDLALFPELFTTGYAHESWPEAADWSTSQAVRELGAIARAQQMWLGGSIVTRSEAGLTNRFWLLSPDGTPSTYDKVHLFPPMGEDLYLQAGTRHSLVDIGEWTAGLSVCFDLRFPEAYRADALSGASLFLVVAEWPRPRCGILRTLARARAIENQAYLLLCNRVGTARDGETFCGGSAIIDPLGEIVAEAGPGEATVTADIDLDLVRTTRSALPVLDVQLDTAAS